MQSETSSLNSEEQIMWALSSLSEPTYENFILFVRYFLKPCMQMEFVEEDYYRDIWESMWKRRHCLMQLPRGHSKTEMVGIWATIYIAVIQPINPFHPKKKVIQQQMLIAGDSAAKAAWSERIKHFFYESKMLRWLVPEGADKTQKNAYWNERVMYLNNGHMILLRAIGEKAIRGNHIDRLHADDLVTENSTLVDQAIKDKWDGAVDGTTTNKLAMVQVTGTPLRFSDILFHLKDKGYFFKKLPAIIDWDKKEILSPRRWRWQDLMKTKERIGPVRFQCEYMLDPIDDTTSLIKGEWIDQCLNSDLDLYKTRPDFVDAVYLGVDFAFSDRITADRSAFVILAEVKREAMRHWIILDIITRKGMSALEQLDLIKELNTVYKFDLIALEENSIKSVTKQINSLNLPIKRFWTGNRDEREEQSRAKKQFITVSKRNLILRLGTALEQNKIEIPCLSYEAKKKSDELRNECISFAQEEDKLVEIGVHPDIPIALGYAYDVATRWNSGAMIF